MEFKDLTKEEQKHFLEVVKYCQDNDLMERMNEATHLDFDSKATSLTKFIGDVEYFYDNDFKGWIVNPCPSNLYLKPDNTSETSTWKWEELRGKTVEVCVDKEGMVILKDDYGYFYVVK